MGWVVKIAVHYIQLVQVHRLTDFNTVHSKTFRIKHTRTFCSPLCCFCVLQVVLIIYCAKNGDIYRILNGYDTCGNVCGRYNEPIEGYDKLRLCFGENMSQKRCVKNL
jgi:hypothetical protein